MIGLVSADRLSSNKRFLPVIMVFGEADDPPRPVRVHITLEGKSAVSAVSPASAMGQPVVRSGDEEDTTIICVGLLLVRR